MRHQAREVDVCEIELLTPGTQVVYIPQHIRESVDPDKWLKHPAAEWGFVVHSGKWAQTVYCRFWELPEYHENMYDLKQQRESVLVSARLLLIAHLADQEVVDTLVGVCGDQDRSVNQWLKEQVLKQRRRR
jgi:hypothetical protein